MSSRSIIHWPAFERSIEALANSFTSSNAAEDNGKKGLRFEDLLIKVRDGMKHLDSHVNG